MTSPDLPADLNRPSGHLVVVGLSHERAPLDVRERAALGPAALDDAYRRLDGLALEGLILSTCARTEVVALVERACDVGALERALVPEGIRAHVHRHTGRAAARYLARIAAGLESPIPGEPEILGQVKAAAERARAAGLLGPVLSQLVIAAVRAGRRARAETAISRGAATLGSAAIRLAEDTLGELDGRLAVVVGAGEAARPIAKSLVHRGLRVSIVNRTEQRADALAAAVGATARPWAVLADVIAESDLVIAVTSAPDPIIQRELLDRSPASARPKVLVDLGLPRNVAPDVELSPNVTRFDLDAIRESGDRTTRERESATTAAAAIVDEEIERFHEWRRRQRVVPTITALTTWAGAIREREVIRALGADGDAELERKLRTLADRLVAQMLDGAIRRLGTDPDGPALSHAVARLFPVAQPGTAQ